MNTTPLSLLLENAFIQKNLNKKLSEVALLLSRNPSLDKEYIINQINGIQKSKAKIPSFYENPNIIYPTGLSLEQCSSEKTATYKSSILTGKTLIDLTGGFGIDSYFFSRKMHVTYLEPDKNLFEIVKQNFEVLNPTIDCYHSTCENFIETTTQTYDIAYIDPSRRNANDRVYKLKDCSPDVIDLLPKLLKITKKVLIKTSPLLDIKQTLHDLENVSKVWVVSVENECKEVLYCVENKLNHNPEIAAVNLDKINTEFSFTFDEEKVSEVQYSLPQKFLYEPNSSILKSGGFRCVAQRYKINKLNTNTHLYTSEKLLENFQGRTFSIQAVIDFQYKSFKTLNIKKANVSVRNFPDNIEQIKKKLKLNDGGEIYLFATRNIENNPVLIITKKVI